MHKHFIVALAFILVACSGHSDSSKDNSDDSASGDKDIDAGKTGSDASSDSKSGTKSGGSIKTGSASGTDGNSESGAEAAGAAAPDASLATLLGLPDTSWPAAEDGLTTEKVDAAPTFHVTRPADLDSLDMPMPVVVWANGGCFRSDFTWVPMFNRWAHAGFIVLSLTGTGADGDLLSMLGSTSNTEHDQLIDWVTKQNDDGPYAGKIDLDRIVVAGNSCGGVTALEVASQDNRLAAVFVLSGSSALGSVDKSIMEKIKIPVGYIVGGPEDVAGANASGDYDALSDGIPAMIVHRRVGDHPTVSTDPMVLPQDAEISLNWLELALYGKQDAYDALNSENVCDVCTPGDWTLQAKNLESLVK